MVRVPGNSIDVRIFCDGEYLPEYSVVVDGNKVTCWIPSDEGKAFEIHMESKSPIAIAKAFELGVYFDGGSLPVKSGVARSRCVVDRLNMEDGVYRRFCFSKLTLLEDDGASQLSEERAKSLGTVRVQIHHVQVIQVMDRQPPAVVSQSALAPPALNERSKKGGGHVISLGPEVAPERAQKMISVERLKNSPPLDVVFRYAPKELLIAREIIPKPLSPPPVFTTSTAKTAVKREREESDDNLAALTDEEDAAAYARLKAKIAAKKRAKGTAAKPEPIETSTRIFKKSDIIVLSD